MDLSSLSLRVQRITILVTVVLTTVVFWKPVPDEFGLPKATVLWIAAVIVLACCAARAVWDRELRLPRSAWAIVLLAVAVAVVVTTVASPTPVLSVVGEYNRDTGLLTYLSYAVLGFAALRTFDVDEAALLLRVLTVLLAVVGAYGLLQVLDIDPYKFGVETLGVRLGVAGTLGNANLFAGFLAIAVPAALWQALSATSTTRWRLAGGATALLGFVVAVGTKSFQGPAAAIPGALVVLGVWATTEDGRRARALLRERAGGAARAIPAVAGVVVLAAAVIGRGAVREGLASGFVERGDFWRAALKMFRSNPLLGTGFDTYGQHFLAERPVGHAVSYLATQAESAHSVPLNLLAGGGLVVALAWLALVGVTAWALVHGVRRLDGEERLLLGGLGGAWVAYQLQALVSFDVPALGVLHVILAGSIVAIGAPPRWIPIRLPGAPARVQGGRGHERVVLPTSSLVTLAVLALLALVGSWMATRPLRADLAFGHAADQANHGDAKGAIASAKHATDLAPWQGRYWVLRAQYAEASQEVFEAADLAEVAARREPGSSQYALLVASLNVRYRTPEMASRWFDEALDRDPYDPVVLAAVITFESDHDPKRALALVEEWRAIAPDSPDPLVALGDMKRAQGRDDEARAAYEQALAITPGYAQAAAGIAALDAPPVDESAAAGA